MADKKGKPAAPTALEEINVFPIPARDVELTEEERGWLEDPEWITEDESDIIVAERRLAEGGLISLEDFLRDRGQAVKR